jgi:hypothetical protein
MVPIAGFCKTENEDAAIKLVHDYYQFIFSYSDVPNAHFRAGDIFDYPITDDEMGYEGPGGDSETYEIVDKNYEILKVETKKDHLHENNFKKDDVIVTARFKTLGFIDLFKKGFKEKNGFEDVTFYCSKSKGKYRILNLSNWYIRSYESALKYGKFPGLSEAVNELQSSRKARENQK